ncbi:MAG: MarR family winged helix-turn-helix transcriptional regulator [Acidimicrobiia bacterium]
MAEPWDDPIITTFGMLHEAHAAVLADVSRDLEAMAGIPLPWYEVLLRLARSPEQRLRMAELAHQVGLSTSGLTRLVDRVEEAGYVARQSCTDDRRGAFAVLTPAGQEILRGSLPQHVESLRRRVAAPLGADADRLTELLRALRDA